MQAATAKRRVGAEGSETWIRIVEATEAVIREEGYAAASTRRVATYAGLKPSLVHYYFPTTDDLFLAVHRHGAAKSDALVAEALDSDDPIRALWHFFVDSSRSTLAIEFMALATHRKAIQTQIAMHSEEMRLRQADVIGRLMAKRPAGSPAIDPAALSLVMAGIGRALVTEGALGIEGGHAAARALVEGLLDGLAKGSATPDT